MSSSNDYDVIVLGGGAPGEHYAAALAARGLRVAVVERELVGGEWSSHPRTTVLHICPRAAGPRARRRRA